MIQAYSYGHLSQNGLWYGPLDPFLQLLCTRPH